MNYIAKSQRELGNYEMVPGREYFIDYDCDMEQAGQIQFEIQGAIVRAVKAKGHTLFLHKVSPLIQETEMPWGVGTERYTGMRFYFTINPVPVAAVIIITAIIGGLILCQLTGTFRGFGEFLPKAAKASIMIAVAIAITLAAIFIIPSFFGKKPIS